MQMLQIKTLNTDLKEKLSAKLNVLLANYQVFLMNVKGYLWNLNAKESIELNQLLASLKSHLILKIEAIEYHIISLDKIPSHRFDGYVIVSDVKPARVLNDSYVACEDIVKSFEQILKKQRVIVRMSREANEHHSEEIINNYILEQEDMMLSFAKLMS
jgi:starvation-inducible DNA-binding protein